VATFSASVLDEQGHRDEKKRDDDDRHHRPERSGHIASSVAPKVITAGPGPGVGDVEVVWRAR
jgi:hypothetical protein